MGNCIKCMQSSKKNFNILVSNSEEKFKASTKVGKIISGSYHGYDLVPPNKKLHPAEVYILMPEKDKISKEAVEHFGYMVPQKVKIVVTRKQLEFLIRNADDFQIKEVSHVPSWKRTVGQKWKPCLATIKE